MKFYSGDMFLPYSTKEASKIYGGLDIFIQRQLKNPGPLKANL